MEKPNISVNSKKSSFIGSENCLRLLNKKSTQISPRIKRTKSINYNASYIQPQFRSFIQPDYFNS